MVKKTNKKSNSKRNIKGSHKGKKGVTPYKFYIDREEILKKRYKEDLVDRILETVVVCDSNPKKVGDLIQRWFISKGIDLSELKEEDFNRRIK